MVTIPSRTDHLIPENTNDGFATQSSYHRFVVRVFHDLASLGAGQNPQPQQQTTQTTTTAAGSAADQAYRPVAGKLITVKTDVLELTINTNGGDIEQALLLAYPKTLKSTEPFQLLETTPQFVYQRRAA